MNQLVPLALSSQGKPAFHASAVCVPGGAVAFLGRAGSGKSTLAAAFALGESSFLTDDALLIEERGDTYLAKPSHASLRLWRDSVDALADGSCVDSAGSISYSSKTRLLAGAMCWPTKTIRSGCSPLSCWASTSPHPIGSSAARDGSDRYRAWLDNSFLLDIEDRDLLTRHFDWTHRISGRVPTYGLDYVARLWHPA